MKKDSTSAKKALDTVIRKSRVHFYKPIQIAEILFHHRIEKDWNLNDLETYRNASKRWRDEVSTRLVGRKSTSSQKYQDNVFEENAMPPELMVSLGDFNKKSGGVVESYVYHSLKQKLSLVHHVQDYIANTPAEKFSIKELVAMFVSSAGLKRSTDKMYEIAVYALFSSIVRHLKAQITIEIGNFDKKVLKDFEGFIKLVLGISADMTKIAMPAALYRLGVTNAADRGLDMWSNFGAAIQVKHLTLTPELVEEIADGISADRIVIVCKATEKEAIATLLEQVGWGSRIQGIITLDDLEHWYELCLRGEHKDVLAKSLLSDIKREFALEFPSGAEINPFIHERKYDGIKLPEDWSIKS